MIAVLARSILGVKFLMEPVIKYSENQTSGEIILPEATSFVLFLKLQMNYQRDRIVSINRAWDQSS